MAAPKGHPKWGGKKKGYRSITLKSTVREILQERGHDPVNALIDIAEDPNSSPELKAHVEAKLTRFVYPELRSTEIVGPNGGPLQHAFTSPRELLAARIAGIAERNRASGGGSKPE